MADDSSQDSERGLIEYVELPKEDGVRRVQFQTNTGRLTIPFQRDLQRLLDCARLAVEAINDRKEFSGNFHSSTLQLHPAKNRRLSIDDLKPECVQWVLCSAFRDVMESFQPILEDARQLLALWSMGGKIPAEEWNARMNGEGQRFHRLGLRDKLDFLENRYGLPISQQTREILVSLNDARNCLVHRGGVVASRDCRDGKVLRAIWREITTFSGDVHAKPDTYNRIRPGDVIESGEYLILGPAQKVAEYPIGSRLSLSAQDLSEICDTLFALAKGFAKNLNEKSLALGIGQTPKNV